ncbi:MAG: hypothetical protein CVT89_04850 [Candidatus Altiarchaeales archaeon HGW-Altiarchaeales-2]|nr:MAG: hypothetical protein CVT89_04850 [Candidatus Altiarchaeales archaeon HGW-Altiarchaeales-2]
MLAILQKNLEKKVDMGYEFREYVEGCYSDQVFEDINCLINVGFASVKGHFKHVYRLTDFGRMDFDWLKKDKLKQEIKEEVDKVVKEYTKKELMDVVDEVRELCINYEDLFEKYKEDKDVQLIINGTRKENM